MAGKADLVKGIIAEHGEFPWQLGQAETADAELYAPATPAPGGSLEPFGG
jgi:hypothetical protein